MSSDRDECVGTLLVHQSDMKELSAATNNKNEAPKEAVGSLTVSQSEMQELSESTKEATANKEAVGTLLVSSGDMEELSTQKKSGGEGLVRRITKKIDKAEPYDDADILE